MQNSSWVNLLRQIPTEQYHNLMVVTAAGIEIAIQTILRIDPEFLAIKGRLAGSQDAGRVFFLPYSHIDYFGFQAAVKETEFIEMFGDGSAPVAATAADGEADGMVAASVIGLPANGGAPRGAPIKSAVLERFRSRVTAQGTGFRPTLDG